MATTSTDKIVHLSELETGNHHFAFELDDTYFREIEKAEIQGGKVAIEAELQLMPDFYRLTISAQGEVELICDRCLGLMTYPVDVTDDILPDESDASDDSDTLDIAWLAYEMITTHLPLVHSHPEGACMPDMQELLQAHLCSTVEEPDIVRQQE